MVLFLLDAFRGFFNGIGVSPRCQPLGTRNGRLVFPLDLVYASVRLANGAVVSQPPSSIPGALIGAPVFDGGSSAIGTVSNYDFPSFGPIVPLVEVTPSSTLPPGLEFAGQALPDISINDLVTLFFVAANGQVVPSQIVGFISALRDPSRAFFTPGRSVDSFVVNFGSPIFNLCGARVMHNKSNQLLGMLCLATGTQALVFPADRL
jgi:hypothetical protein